MPGLREQRAVTGRAAAQIGHVRDAGQPGGERGAQISKRPAAVRLANRIQPGDLIVRRLIEHGCFVGHLTIISGAVWPRPTHVGNEKYLGGFWTIEASDLDVALELRCETVGSSYGRRYQKVLKDIREAVSDRGRGVR